MAKSALFMIFMSVSLIGIYLLSKLNSEKMKDNLEPREERHYDSWQQAMKKQAMKKEAMKKHAMKKEAMKKQAMKNGIKDGSSTKLKSEKIKDYLELRESKESNVNSWQQAMKRNGIKQGSSPKDDCAALFEDANTKLTELSESYARQNAAFNSHLMENEEYVNVEGNTGTQGEQQLFYWTLGGMSSVRTICEIGFNAGHSALVWLESNSNVHLYSIDVNSHRYTPIMASYLKEIYTKRFDIFFGTSDTVIPSISQKEHISCDILVVDGGHFKDQALKDIVNMKRLAHKDSLLIVDDTAYGAVYSDPVMASVNKLLSCDYIDVQYICSYAEARGRGFALFTYNSNNTDACVFTIS